jgi:hypothetical protein
MRTSSLIVALAGLAVVPVAVGAIAVDQIAGTLAGTGVTPTHDFPVDATRFDIRISDPDADGFRNVEVRVPVLAIDTDSEGRNKHMRNTIFEGHEAPGKGEVVFQARTDSPLSAGSVQLDGRLSILGRAQPLTVTATLSGEVPLRAEGSATIDLGLWGIDPPGFGPMRVSDQVSMGFDVMLPVPRAPDLSQAE